MARRKNNNRRRGNAGTANDIMPTIRALIERNQTAQPTIDPVTGEVVMPAPIPPEELAEAIRQMSRSALKQYNLTAQEIRELYQAVGRDFRAMNDPYLQRLIKGLLDQGFKMRDIITDPTFVEYKQELRSLRGTTKQNMATDIAWVRKMKAIENDMYNNLIEAAATSTVAPGLPVEAAGLGGGGSGGGGGGGRGFRRYGGGGGRGSGSGDPPPGTVEADITQTADQDTEYLAPGFSDAVRRLAGRPRDYDSRKDFRAEREIYLNMLDELGPLPYQVLGNIGDMRSANAGAQAIGAADVSQQINETKRRRQLEAAMFDQGVRGPAYFEENAPPGTSGFSFATEEDEDGNKRVVNKGRSAEFKQLIRSPQFQEWIANDPTWNRRRGRGGRSMPNDDKLAEVARSILDIRDIANAYTKFNKSDEMGDRIWNLTQLARSYSPNYSPNVTRQQIGESSDIDTTVNVPAGNDPMGMMGGGGTSAPTRLGDYGDIVKAAADRARALKEERERAAMMMAAQRRLSEPPDYSNGAWRNPANQPVAYAPTEDSAPYVNPNHSIPGGPIPVPPRIPSTPSVAPRPTLPPIFKPRPTGKRKEKDAGYSVRRGSSSYS